MTSGPNFVHITTLLLLSIGGAQAGFADQEFCTPVRLDVPPGSMSKVPVLDQGSFADCYASSGAQLVDAYRFSHGDRRTDLHTSALMAAVAYVRDSSVNRDKIDGAVSPCPCIDLIGKKGACNSVSLRTRWGKEAEFYMSLFAQWQTQIADSRSINFQFNNASDWLRGIPEGVEKRRKMARTYSSYVCDYLRDNGFHNPLPSLDALTQLLQEDKPAELIDALRAGLCSGNSHFDVKVPACRDESLGTWLPTVAKHEDVLNFRLTRQNAQPIAISYCSRVLLNGRRYDGNAFQTPLGLGYIAKDCGLHSSLVIGRRPNPKTGRCEFLVRNSWGKTCYGYSKDWQCENGNIWVDAESLSKNIYGLSYLQ